MVGPYMEAPNLRNNNFQPVSILDFLLNINVLIPAFVLAVFRACMVFGEEGNNSRASDHTDSSVFLLEFDKNFQKIRQTH